MTTRNPNARNSTKRETDIAATAALLDHLGVDARTVAEVALRAENDRIPTFAEAVPAFLLTLKPRTADTYVTSLRHYVEVFGARRINELTLDNHRAFIRRRAEGASRQGRLSTSVIESMSTAVKSLEQWCSQQPHWSFRPTLADLTIEIIRDPEARISLTTSQLHDVMTLGPGHASRPAPGVHRIDVLPRNRCPPTSHIQRPDR